MKLEDVNYNDFWDKLGRFIHRKHLEPMFDEANEMVAKHEYIYDELRQTLDAQKEDDLVLYVASCEAFCNTYAFAAYEMGREEGPRESPLMDWCEYPNFWEEVQQRFERLGYLDETDLELMRRAPRPSFGADEE
ncbi:MAG: hypothetical protein Q4F17_12495 [Eubacteriales bacterium]|nr:hypothetical protein [Eubacteriales bacterium]